MYLSRVHDIILALELSTPAASMALWKNGDIALERQWTADRNHTEFFSHLKDALALLENQAIGLIIVGSGPGSYGGIRVALAAADGISLPHDSSIVSICSWEALESPSPAPLCVIANARRNGWVTGTVTDGKVQGELTIIPSPDMPAWLAGKAGQNIPLLSTESQENLDKENFGQPVASRQPQARLLITSWLARTNDEQAALLQAPPSPIYVRPPHITPAKTPPWFVQSQF